MVFRSITIKTIWIFSIDYYIWYFYLKFNVFLIIYLFLIGIMDHEEARKRHTGGKALGFFY